MILTNWNQQICIVTVDWNRWCITDICVGDVECFIDYNISKPQPLNQRYSCRRHTQQMTYTYSCTSFTPANPPPCRYGDGMFWSYSQLVASSSLHVHLIVTMSSLPSYNWSLNKLLSLSVSMQHVIESILRSVSVEKTIQIVWLVYLIYINTNDSTWGQSHF